MAEAKKIIRETIKQSYTSSRPGSTPTFYEVELELDGASFAEALTKIQELQKEFESEYTDIRFDVYYDYSDDKYDHRKIYLTGAREETDEEYATRIETAARRVTEQRERDEADLAQLAARLGKTVS